MAGHKDIVKMLLPLSSETLHSTVDQILEDGIHRMSAWTDRSNAQNEALKVSFSVSPLLCYYSMLSDWRITLREGSF